jgi:hypothetical protein
MKRQRASPDGAGRRYKIESLIDRGGESKDPSPPPVPEKSAESNVEERIHLLEGALAKNLRVLQGG